MNTPGSENQPSGKRELNRMRNRKAILNAARECFRETGYENTTIRDIVRSTGLAAGTFYNYFCSKQDIFSALLTDFLAQLHRNLKDCRNRAGTADEFIRTTYHALFSATADDPLVYELAHRNEHAIRELFGSDLLGLAMVSLDEDIQRAVLRGILPDVDREYLCAALFGVAYELSLRLAYRAHQSPDRKVAETLMATEFATDLFLGGLSRMQPFRTEGLSPTMHG